MYLNVARGDGLLLIILVTLLLVVIVGSSLLRSGVSILGFGARRGKTVRRGGRSGKGSLLIIIVITGNLGLNRNEREGMEINAWTLRKREKGK